MIFISIIFILVYRDSSALNCTSKAIYFKGTPNSVDCYKGSYLNVILVRIIVSWFVGNIIVKSLYQKTAIISSVFVVIRKGFFSF